MQSQIPEFLEEVFYPICTAILVLSAAAMSAAVAWSVVRDTVKKEK